VPSVVINMAKVILDITAEYSRSLHGDTSRYCVKQSIVRLEAIGILY
jgi:hypothetical protein